MTPVTARLGGAIHNWVIDLVKDITMHLSYLTPLNPAPESQGEDIDGGRARPVRALIVTIAVTLAFFVTCEALSPGLLTRALPSITG